MTNRPARPETLRPANLSGWWVAVALFAIVLQAPSLTVRHAHAGGESTHHHGAVGCGPACMSPNCHDGEDLLAGHGHRLVWGLELHDPADGSPTGPASDPTSNPGTSGMICAGQGPATLDNQTALTLSPPTGGLKIPTFQAYPQRPIKIHLASPFPGQASPQNPLVLKI